MSTLDLKKITQLPLVFFLGLYFLIFICYFGSYISSLHFLLTLQAGTGSNILAKFLFLIFTCLYLVKPQSGYTIYKTLTSSILLENFFSFMRKLNKFTEKHPLLCFFLVYIYILLLLLHWYMRLFTGIDFYVEYLYNCFNIFRLLLFPLVIFSYVILYGPSSFKVIDISSNINLEEIKKILKSSISFTEKVFQQYPKSAKSGALLLGAGAVIGAGAMSHGSGVRSSILDGAQAPVISAQLNRLDTPECLQDEKCQELIGATMRLFAQINKSNLSLTYHDVNALAHQEPTLSDDWTYLLQILPKVNANAIEKALKEKSDLIASKAVNIEQPLPLTSSTVESQLTNSETTVVPFTRPPGASTPVEDFWYFF